MPQFKISKTRYINRLPAIYDEDTLYIVKNKNDYAELYYDYAGDKRIKLGDSKQIYQCNNEISLNDDGIGIVLVNSLNLIELVIENGQIVKKLSSLSGSDPNLHNVDIGQFILAPNGIFIIEHLTNLTVDVIAFYLKESLEWIDIN